MTRMAKVWYNRVLMADYKWNMGNDASMGSYR